MTDWLTDDEQRAWRNLIGMTMLLPTALDGQLRRDSGLTNFDYWILAMLSESPGRVLRMSDLAGQSNSSLSRLSHAVGRLEDRGYVERSQLAGDGRVHEARLTEPGWAKVVEAAPGHVDCVRSIVFEGLTTEQVAQMEAICGSILERLTTRTEAVRQ